MLTDLFMEVILLLNKLPLFSIYHKQKDMRNKYALDYHLALEPESAPSLIILTGKDYLRRHNGQIAIQASVSYMPSFDHLWKMPFEAPEQELTRKSSMVHSDYGGERKVSIFEFHDP